MGHVKGRRTDPGALRDLIAARGLTLRGFSASAGISYSSIKKVATGRRQLSDRLAHKAAQALGCIVDDFSYRPDDEEAAA